VYFYDTSSKILIYHKGTSRKFKDEYNTFAKENRGIFRIGAVDCSEFSKICDKEKITDHPSFKIFPPNPVPATVYKGEDISIEGIKKASSKYI
jgi:hypothetical protein